MNRNHAHLLIACLLATTSLAAQDQASTLVRLSERSDAVVQARVLNSRTVGPTQRVAFKVQAGLKGDLPGSFVLEAPAGRACGHALHGALTGSSYLVFLKEDRAGISLTVGSSRAMLHADPDILGHVRALLGARNGSERLAVLTANLRARNDRVRRDAALALPIRADLELATNSDRDRILAALPGTLAQDERAALGLIQAAARLRLRAAVPVLLDGYLAGRNTALGRILLDAIPTLDPSYAVDQIARRAPSEVREQTRAVVLLSRCPGAHAAECLKKLAESRNQAVSTLATEALATQARAGRGERIDPKHVFRSIDPRGRR